MEVDHTRDKNRVKRQPKLFTAQSRTHLWQMESPSTAKQNRPRVTKAIFNRVLEVTKPVEHIEKKYFH